MVAEACDDKDAYIMPNASKNEKTRMQNRASKALINKDVSNTFVIDK